jgi:hypothetical protein
MNAQMRSQWPKFVQIIINVTISPFIIYQVGWGPFKGTFLQGTNTMIFF